jgi:hypothetical protein
MFKINIVMHLPTHHDAVLTAAISRIAILPKPGAIIVVANVTTAEASRTCDYISLHIENLSPSNPLSHLRRLPQVNCEPIKPEKR